MQWAGCGWGHGGEDQSDACKGLGNTELQSGLSCAKGLLGNSNLHELKQLQPAVTDKP